MTLNYFTALPAAAPAFLNMHVVSTNFAKTLFCKREIDVIVWRHKQRIFSNNDHHSPLFNTRIWKGASNQAVAPGITRPLHATDPKPVFLAIFYYPKPVFFQLPNLGI